MIFGSSDRGSPGSPSAPPAGTRPGLPTITGAAALGAAMLLGLGLRLAVWSYATSDVGDYLQPWYAFARDHGWRALGSGFTNYTPFYSYLLIAITAFDGRAPSLLLIKAISFAFEFGTALVAYRFVLRATQSRNRAGLALVASWLAPAVFYNGALWGQADSVWTFFVVLSVYLFSVGRNGALPFGLAFAVKAQAVFLGPFALGMILRQRRSLLWFAALPLVYLAFALPTLLAGRPLMEVLRIYVDQANTFHGLSMKAANLWALAPGVPYSVGVPIGMTLAAAGGLGITVLVERAKRTDIEFNTLAACLSLLAMPLLLPKMHDRYFYAFEVLSIVLACQNRRYVLVALAAQTSAVLSYVSVEQGLRFGVPVAAVQNLMLAAFLVQSFVRPGATAQPKRWEVAGYVGLSAVLGCLLPFCRGTHPHAGAEAAMLLVSTLFIVHIGLVLFRASRPPAASSGVNPSSSRTNLMFPVGSVMAEKPPRPNLLTPPSA
jgi:Gpi18-like mannosyltransferase